MALPSVDNPSNGLTFIELMVAIAIIGLLIAIVIPNYIHIRNKAYCTETETDAANTAAAIANYFGVGSRTELPDIADLKLSVLNPIEITGNTNIRIVIHVTDRTRRCPFDYRMAHDYWDSNYVFTKYVK